MFDESAKRLGLQSPNFVFFFSNLVHAQRVRVALSIVLADLLQVGAENVEALVLLKAVSVGLQRNSSDPTSAYKARAIRTYLVVSRLPSVPEQALRVNVQWINNSARSNGSEGEDTQDNSNGKLHLQGEHSCELAICMHRPQNKKYWQIARLTSHQINRSDA